MDQALTWIEKKRWFERPGGNGRRPPIKSRDYSIVEMAAILSVSRDTIYKWIAFDAPEEAVIPPTGWYRLPNGRVRIYEWVLEKIRAGEAVSQS